MFKYTCFDFVVVFIYFFKVSDCVFILLYWCASGFCQLCMQLCQKRSKCSLMFSYVWCSRILDINDFVFIECLVSIINVTLFVQLWGVVKGEVILMLLIFCFIKDVCWICFTISLHIPRKIHDVTLVYVVNLILETMKKKSL